MDDISARLSEPFAPEEIEWKPQLVKGNRALGIAYIDARCVEDRLDAVLGTGGWQDHYTVLPDGNVVCALSIRVGDEWVTKEDVGGESDQKDSGDRRKASFSDALKRAAVKFGVGRYLYRLEGQWVDYDPNSKKITSTPKLPAWALPGGSGSAPHAAPSPPKTNAAPAKKTAAAAADKAPAIKSGDQLKAWILKLGDELAVANLINPGELWDMVRRRAESKNLNLDMGTWDAKVVAGVVTFVNSAVADIRSRQPQPA